jgi:hypothetical protein
MKRLFAGLVLALVIVSPVSAARSASSTGTCAWSTNLPSYYDPNGWVALDASGLKPDTSYRIAIDIEGLSGHYAPTWQSDNTGAIDLAVSKNPTPGTWLYTARFSQGPTCSGSFTTT